MAHPFAGCARVAGALRRPGGLPVPRRRDDRREVGPQPRRHGGSSRSRVARAGAAATDAEGRSSDEIVPAGRAHRRRRPAPEPDRDEDPAALTPLSEGGRLTAALSSQISDGAAAILVASRAARSNDHGLTPRARVHHHGVRGADPVSCSPRRSPPPSSAAPRPGCRSTTSTCRDQRGVRLGRARLAEGDRRRPRRRSTSTAARSPSATRSARPAPG